MTEPIDQVETLPGTGAGAGAAAGSAPDQVTGPHLLAGRYLLEERIASGGMAAVWRARDEVLARTVAVKILHDHLAADDAFRERFRREAIAAAKLTHANVVGLYDTGQDGHRVYLVMEFVDGVTLKDVIGDVGALEPGQAAAIGEKVARALGYAHERGLVHRDVKPANILVADDGTVKVADFGIAKAEEGEGDLTRTGMVMGTAAYVSPEQVLTQPIDGRADQYALACCLYEALTGDQPFRGESALATAALRLEGEPPPPRSIRVGIPRELDRVVMRAMARSPDERFESADTLADALAAFADADAEDPTALPSSTATALLAGLSADPSGPARPHADSADPSGPARPHAGPAAPARAAARGTDSLLRSEARWLAPVLGLLALAGALVGIPFAAGLLDVDMPAFGGGRAQERPAPAPRVPLPVVQAASLDPQGDGSENDRALVALTDADPQTTWRTDLYHSAAFGGLKDGVGFWVDLGTPHRLGSVALTTTTPGVAYEVRVADRPAPTVEGWRRLAAVPAAAATEQLRFEPPVTGRYLLVWVTANLQPDGGRYKAEFSELVVHGSPA